VTIYNGYITRAELLREIMSSEDSAAPNAVDDEVLDNIITDASRAVDNFCARQFYAASETLYLDVPQPYSRSIWFGPDVLAVQAASNGDGASMGSGNYYLWPRGAQSFAAIVLKESASLGWVGTSGGDYEGAITVAASVGYVDRAASAASSPAAGQRVIAATRRATLIVASAFYRKRFGQGVEAAKVTAAGVVLTPMGMPRDAAELLEPYIRHGY